MILLKYIIIFLHYKKIKYKTHEKNDFQCFPLLFELFNFEVRYIDARRWRNKYRSETRLNAFVVLW